jgi:V/A-type H+-transporting ATPase subunit E
MGLEQLTATILDEAKKESASAVSAADAERRKMLGEAKAAAEKARMEAEAKTAEFVESQRRERIAWARIEAKRAINEARESVVDGAIEDVFAEMRAFPKSREYPKFLNALVAHGMEELGSPKAVVHVRKEDRKHLNGKNSVKDDLDEWGGCIVESADGSVRVDLTFSALLDQKRELLRKMLYEALFRQDEGANEKGKVKKRSKGAEGKD